MFAEASAQPPAASEAIPFVPCVRLFVERMSVEQADDEQVNYVEMDVPVLALAFEYAGTRIRASDRRKHFFVGLAGGLARVERDAAGEARAQCLLEGFGAVEVECADRYAADLDSQADYIVQMGGNVHTLCSFTAYALPQLESLGFKIEIAGDYPYQVVSPDVPWYANVESTEERSDWFSLELGIEIDGKRVNLVPALLELLEECGDATSLEALLRVPARFRVVPIGENRYLPVPPERLRSVMQVLLELYRGEELADGTFAFPGSRAGTVAKLDEALDSATLLWGGDTDVRKRGRSISTGSRVKQATLTTGLNATLRPYQQEGLDWLQHLVACDVGGVLADDMGLGKTLQTIAHVSTEKLSGRMTTPSLILMPTSLIGNWQREFKKFAPHVKLLVLHGSKREARRKELPDADVVLTTYPLLLRDLEHFRELDFHLLILDEAQAIKNPRSQVNKAVGALSARHRLCLSGTPVENNLEELWSLFDFLMPGFLGDASRFRTAFRHPIEREGNMQKLEALRNAIAPFILRRMKETVAKDLPPKTELVRPVELGGDQRELYESIRAAAHSEVRSAIKKKGIPGSAIAILDALMKLRQVCCDPRLVTKVNSAKSVQGSAKYDLFFELLTTQLEQGRRVLVFSQFTRMLDLLSQGLKERNIGFLALTGASQDRQKLVDEFEGGKADVFLISLKAGGTGLNLTSADTVIHYDPWWNAAAQSQATDRAYRIGQTRPVFVYNLIVAGSVEERMLRLQQKKTQLASTLLGSGGAPSRLTEGDLEDLFAPLAD